jgi:hypothetical protein
MRQQLMSGQIGVWQFCRSHLRGKGHALAWPSEVASCSKQKRGTSQPLYLQPTTDCNSKRQLRRQDS